MRRTHIAMIILIGCFPLSPAKASPMTFACSFEGSSFPNRRFNDVDEVLIDDESNTVELRVARTIGTAEPVNWIVSNRTTTLGTDSFDIQRFSDKWIGSGIYGAAAHSFVLKDNGELNWMLLQDWGAAFFRWRCHR